MIWVKLYAKIPKICQICAVMRDYAEENPTIQEMNSTQITITIPKVTLFNFSELGDVLGKQTRLCCNS